MTAKLVPDNVVISDATVLINFLETDSLEFLISLYAGRFHITNIVRGEVKRGREKLEKAIDQGQVIEHEIPLDEVVHLEKTFSNLHAGEASCIQLAKDRSWKIATLEDSHR